MVRFEELYKSYGKNNVLQGVNLNFNTQGITAILGPNGSGKTTLLKCFLGLTLYDKGNIFYEGKNIKNEFEYKRSVSHLPQIACFPENLSVLELISMIKDLRPGKTNEAYFIEMFHLDKELHKKMGMLSGGNKQKVNLLLSLMFDSPLMILDEPTSGLDPLAIINLKNYLKEEKEKGKLILVTTHIMSFVEQMADQIVFLLDGKIYFNGAKENLLQDHNASNLEEAIAKILRSDMMLHNLKLETA
jgi:Cu-processing system ATP-binding protein